MSQRLTWTNPLGEWGSEILGADRSIIIGRVLLVPIIVLIWQLLSMTFGNLTVPSPAIVLDEIIRGLNDGWLWNELSITIITLTTGFVIASVIGIPIGIWLGSSQQLRDVFEPILLGGYSIPKVTLYPIFLIVLGITVNTRVAFGAIHGVYPVLILTIGGMQAVKEVHLKVGRSFNTTRWQTFSEIIVPSLLPFLVTGLRLGYSLTFIGVILAEMFAGYTGLGQVILSAMVAAEIHRIYAVLVVVAAIGVVGNFLFYSVEVYLQGRTGTEVSGLSGMSSL